LKAAVGDEEEISFILAGETLAEKALRSKSKLQYFLKCDNCATPCEGLRCGGCRCRYYCSSKCQKAEWKSHKKDCSTLVTFSKAQAKGQEIPVIPPSVAALPLAQLTVDEGKAGCSICMEANWKSPIRLDCQHAFCTPCLSEWRKYCASIVVPTSLEEAAPACPLCTDGITPAMELYYEYAGIIQRANLHPKKTKKFVDAMRDAGTKLDGLLVALKKQKVVDALAKHVITMSRAGTHEFVGELKKARAMHKANIAEMQSLSFESNEIGDFLRKRRSNMIRDSMTRSVGIMILQQDWPSAHDILKDMSQYLGQASTPETQQEESKTMRQWFHDSATVFTELGLFDESLNFCEGAIEMNRHYDGVYRPMIKAYTAQGKLDDAIRTAKLAIAYECPWDLENNKMLKDYCDELIKLKREAEITQRAKASSEDDEMD